MNMSELKQELENDLPIKLTDLQFESAQNPVLYGKWLRYMSDLRLQQKKLSNNKIKAQKDRLLYYTGRHENDICIDVFDKTELRTIIPGDKDVMVADTELEIVTIMIDFCKGALDAIKNRGFAIKAIIEQRQLESGK